MAFILSTCKRTVGLNFQAYLWKFRSWQMMQRWCRCWHSKLPSKMIKKYHKWSRAFYGIGVKKDCWGNKYIWRLWETKLNSTSKSPKFEMKSSPNPTELREQYIKEGNYKKTGFQGFWILRSKLPILALELEWKWAPFLLFLEIKIWKHTFYKSISMISIIQWFERAHSKPCHVKMIETHKSTFLARSSFVHCSKQK